MLVEEEPVRKAPATTGSGRKNNYQNKGKKVGSQ